VIYVGYHDKYWFMVNRLLHLWLLVVQTVLLV